MGTSVYPMGVTRYNPDKAWNGYTLMSVNGVGTVLIDMNGNVVKTWVALQGFPSKLLPGGRVFGSLGRRENQYGYQDMSDLTQVNWDGKIEWTFNRLEELHDGDKTYWMARQHHDFQREGNPVGYFVPGMEASVDRGNTLILCHEDKYNKRISDKRLLDDCIIEVDWEGNIVWKWSASDHFNEYGFSETAKNVLYRNPNVHENGGGQSDWLHINSMSVLGPNKWYDAGDERFHPDNIIWDSRESNILAIISKKTGKLVWKIGPDFTETKQLRAIGQIIGQHHVHMIPKGLPGAGNILIFDNGGWAGYGAPSRTSKDGTKTDLRDHSRVIELDPETLKVVWQFDGSVFGGMMDITAKSQFYSQLISSAQRLPNGNTLIDEGCSCRMLEVTPEKEIVWEYIAPFRSEMPFIYRAYRYPYSYVPQLETPIETPVVPLDNHDFRVPGAAVGNINHITKVEGTWGMEGKMDACVTEEQIVD
ncbi:aryl-sulfate sulfotransferase [Clostridium hydrogenum]|uniref:aryl-sulfate sulfotransferase n=1 Tax=Clostridium hydrogenum TaxID=2855764 RepID=UPI001F216D84|nr:aryl-sulfate sulfotransferase [Clostridium hydrogenum]